MEIKVTVHSMTRPVPQPMVTRGTSALFKRWRERNV